MNLGLLPHKPPRFEPARDARRLKRQAEANLHEEGYTMAAIPALAARQDYVHPCPQHRVREAQRSSLAMQIPI